MTSVRITSTLPVYVPMGDHYLDAWEEDDVTWQSGDIVNFLPGTPISHTFPAVVDVRGTDNGGRSWRLDQDATAPFSHRFVISLEAIVLATYDAEEGRFAVCDCGFPFYLEVPPMASDDYSPGLAFVGRAGMYLRTREPEVAELQRHVRPFEVVSIVLPSEGPGGYPDFESRGETTSVEGPAPPEGGFVAMVRPIG